LAGLIVATTFFALSSSRNLRSPRKKLPQYRRKRSTE
jgi:hypothetical protein